VRHLRWPIALLLAALLFLSAGARDAAPPASIGTARVEPAAPAHAAIAALPLSPRHAGVLLATLALAALAPALARLAPARGAWLAVLLACASPLLFLSQVPLAEHAAAALGCAGLALALHAPRWGFAADAGAAVLLGLAAAAAPLGAPAWLVAGGIIAARAGRIRALALAVLLAAPLLATGRELLEAIVVPTPAAPLHFRAPFLRTLAALLADPAHGVLAFAPWLAVLLPWRRPWHGGVRRRLVPRACLTGVAAQLAFLATCSLAIDEATFGPRHALPVLWLGAIAAAPSLARGSAARLAAVLALPALAGLAMALVGLLMWEPRLAQARTWSLRECATARLLARGIVHLPRAQAPRRLWIDPALREGWNPEERWAENPVRWTRLAAEEERPASAEPMRVEFYVGQPGGTRVTVRDLRSGLTLHRGRYHAPGTYGFELPASAEPWRLHWEVSRPMPPAMGDDRIMGVAVIRPGVVRGS
jgi:hypothetical protein